MKFNDLFKSKRRLIIEEAYRILADYRALRADGNAQCEFLMSLNKVNRDFFGPFYTKELMSRLKSRPPRIVNKSMIIGIAGHGFVGDALEYGIKHLTKDNELIIYDPHKYSVKISDMIKCNLIFVCVPTPMDVGGGMDCSIIESVCSELLSLNYKGVVVIKSTVTPVHVRALRNKFSNLRIATNPEFLTERKARMDMLNSEWVVIGTDSGDSEDLIYLSKCMWPQAEISVVSPEDAMMVKYMTNIWFATKVSLMNEFYKLYEKIGGKNWESTVKALSTDIRVGRTHLGVGPFSPDGSFGFGGKCFVKDINALLAVAREYNTIHNVMDATVETNKAVRTNKDWLNIDSATTQAYKEQSNGS